MGPYHYTSYEVSRETRTQVSELKLEIEEPSSLLTGCDEQQGATINSFTESLAYMNYPQHQQAEQYQPLEHYQHYQQHQHHQQQQQQQYSQQYHSHQHHQYHQHQNQQHLTTTEHQSCYLHLEQHQQHQQQHQHHLSNEQQSCYPQLEQQQQQNHPSVEHSHHLPAEQTHHVPADQPHHLPVEEQPSFYLQNLEQQQQQQQIETPTAETSNEPHQLKDSNQIKRSGSKKRTTRTNTNETKGKQNKIFASFSFQGCGESSGGSSNNRTTRLHDIDECATYKDADIEHTSTHIIVNNLTPDGIHIGEPVKLTNKDLIQLTVRQLNKIVQGFPKATIAKLKARRRTLKNRGYAQNCRHKRLNQKHMLEAQNNKLREELREEKLKFGVKLEEYRRRIQELELELKQSNLKRQLVQHLQQEQQQQQQHLHHNHHVHQLQH